MKVKREVLELQFIQQLPTVAAVLLDVEGDVKEAASEAVDLIGAILDELEERQFIE